jgi:hypothetical protein
MIFTATGAKGRYFAISPISKKGKTEIIKLSLNP